MGEMVVIAIMVIAIVLIVGMSVNGIVDKVVHARALRLQASPGTDGKDIRDVIERQQMIEERLQVLERIATDRGNLLADEIEALRAGVVTLAPVRRKDEEPVR